MTVPEGDGESGRVPATGPHHEHPVLLEAHEAYLGSAALQLCVVPGHPLVAVGLGNRSPQGRHNGLEKRIVLETL